MMPFHVCNYSTACAPSLTIFDAAWKLVAPSSSSPSCTLG